MQTQTQTSQKIVFGWMMMALAAFVLTLGWEGPAQAQDNGEIKVQVRTIHVQAQGDTFDTSLTDLKQDLIKGFKGYTSFKARSQDEAKVTAGGAHKFVLPDGNHLQMTFRDAPSGLVRLGLNVDGKFKTNVRVSRGNTFFQAGLPYEGGILVIAIKVD